MYKITTNMWNQTEYTIPCQVYNNVRYKQDKPNVWRAKYNKTLANRWLNKQPDTDNKANLNKRNTDSDNMQYE
jgi:hypothetical protein